MIKVKNMAWWLAVLIAIDQLLNTILWGYPDETLSSRAYRMDGKKARWTLARKLIDGIFFWQEEHCYQSFLTEKALHQLPIEFRGEKE